jgi:hypothetical protein
MMHQVVLREAAGASPGAARVTPVGRETARAILRIRGAELGARALARDEAANGALRYLFREVAGKLADIWRNQVATTEPERSELWKDRSDFTELEEVYDKLGVTDYSDPLEPKLCDVAAIYDIFRRQGVRDDDVSILTEETSIAAYEASKALRASVDRELALFPAALKARVLRAMGLEAYAEDVADIGNFAAYLSAYYGPSDAMERAVRALAASARERLAIVRDVAKFARAVFGDGTAGPSSASPVFRTAAHPMRERY